MNLAEFFFPRICGGCLKRLSPHEKGICVSCKAQLQPYELTDSLRVTRFSTFSVNLRGIHAGYSFSYGDVSRQIIHSIKYEHNKEAGIEFGRMLARVTGIDPADYDIIVPVPVHRVKLVRRRYNQAAVIAEGVSIETGIKLEKHVLKRKVYRSSQTSKRRSERIQALSGVFALAHKERLMNKRILLFDDVVTTGATLSEAAQTLSKASVASLSVLVAAVDV